MRRRYRPRKSPKKETGVQKRKTQGEDFITPLDFFEMGGAEELSGSSQEAAGPGSRRRQGVFVIGTDAGVGKTVAICALGALLKEKGLEIAAMKPVECGGEDARIFIDAFAMTVGKRSISPYLFQKKMSPYFLFKTHKQTFDLKKVLAAYRNLCRDHDMTFIEGTGGLFDPITDKATIADMVRELGLGVIIVAPLRRGSMNHVIMTADRAREKGIGVLGVLFTAANQSSSESLYQAKMKAVKDMARVPVLGMVPFLKKGSQEDIQEICRPKIDVNALLTRREKRGEKESK